MRTTLSIDADVVAAARALAHRDGRTLGEVITDLARKGLDRPVAEGRRNGLILLSGTAPASLDLVNDLRDDLPEDRGA